MIFEIGKFGTLICCFESFDEIWGSLGQGLDLFVGDDDDDEWGRVWVKAKGD